jgi:cytochrome b pre-mRNA-processing protein 3
MFNFWRKNPLRDQADALYEHVVAGARRPEFFLNGHVPDTVQGRLEAMTIHTLLILRRLTTCPEPGPGIAQLLTDRVFAEYDRALREIGVGDLSVGKKMKKIAASYNGSAKAYLSALDAGDAAALAEALERNIHAPGPVSQPSRLIAQAMLASDQAMRKRSLEEIMAGTVPWPVIDGLGDTSAEGEDTKGEDI